MRALDPLPDEFVERFRWDAASDPQHVIETIWMNVVTLVMAAFIGGFLLGAVTTWLVIK